MMERRNLQSRLMAGLATAVMIAVTAAAALVAGIAPVPAFAAQTSSSSASTELSTVVPDTHAVRLSVAEHARVTVGERSFAGPFDGDVDVPRLAEQRYAVDADDGYAVDAVSYDGKAVTLTDGAYVAPAVNEDGHVLTVTVRRLPVKAATSAIAKTGSDAAFTAVAAAVAAALGLAVLAHLRSRR